MNEVKKQAGASMTLNIYWWCCVVLFVFGVSSVLIVTMAGVIADDAHSKKEKTLVLHYVEQQISLLARDQSQISRWDDTVVALTEPVNEDFVEEEMEKWLWSDFAVEYSIVVQSDNKALISIHQDEVMHPSAGNSFIDQAIDLISAAREKYIQRRMPKGNGYFVPSGRMAPEDPFYVADVRPIDGKPAYVIAQAIVPDDDAVLPDGPAKVLLTIKPATLPFWPELHKHDDLLEISIVGAEAIPDGHSALPVGIPGDMHNVYAVWKASPPSRHILMRSVVPLVALFIMAAGALFLVARRSGAALSALQASEEKNRFLALHDALTELPNRVQFDQALEQVITDSQQDRAAILCVDLDRFKAVNDTFGHHAGDAVLKTIAKRIANTVGTAGIAARIGGDEFIVLLHDELDRQSVIARCDAIIESVCKPILFEGGVADVGASIGVAWWPDDALTAKAVIRSADEALYTAKELGRGRTYLAGSLMRGDVADKASDNAPGAAA